MVHVFVNSKKGTKESLLGFPPLPLLLPLADEAPKSGQCELSSRASWLCPTRVSRASLYSGGWHVHTRGQVRYQGRH